VAGGLAGLGVRRGDVVATTLRFCICGAAPVPAEALLGFAGERLAAYKVPVEVRMVDAVPRNPVGKLDKPRMRAMLGA